MIDETLLKSNFLGKDGFVWWIGRVANPNVWRKENIIMSQSESLGQRCKVRIIGYHPFSDALKEEDLPWATVMMDAVTGGGQGGMGDSLCLVGGESCVGFFLDGEEAQQPVIIGVLNRGNNVKNSISVSELQQGSSQGKPFTGGQLNKLTKTKRAETEPVQQPSSDSDPVQGKVKKEDSNGTEQGVIQPNGDSSPAAVAIEKKTTREQFIPSTCGDDAISRMTQVITDFISLVNGLESSLGTFVDPLVNEIVDMDTEIKKIVRVSKGVVKSIINNIRDGLFGKLTTIFSTFLGNLNLINPLDFITDAVSNKAFQAILDTIFCLFEKLLGDLTGFLTNIFKSLLGQVINGPFCAAEQFVSGIFSKIFSVLEDLLAPVLSGLEWLTGGIGEISGFLRNVSNLATAIFNFIGCDGKKCTTPSKWVSSFNASLKESSDNWAKQVENINFLDGVAEDLSKLGRDVNGDIDEFFGTDEFKDTDYNGMRIGDVLEATDRLTGGDAAGALDKGLGSIESAIAITPLFGDSSIFNACNQKISNPQTQDDIIRMPLGYQYGTCIPPEVRIFGTGTGAEALPIVDSSRSIIAVKMISKGSGYDNQTSTTVIDNTNIGYGAELKPIIKDGTVDKIVVVRSGVNYCPNRTSDGVTDSPVGIVTSVYIDTPGIGYTDGDTITIIDEDRPTGLIEPDINLPVIVTPGNGSIVGVIPDTETGNREFSRTPTIIINTQTGRGASLIPVMEFKPKIDTDNSGVKRSTLVGITSVIDCI